MGKPLLRQRLMAAGQNLGALFLLAIAFPFTCLVVLGTLLINGVNHWRAKEPSQQLANPNPRTVLIAGARMTKSLQLARSFHAAGHRAILVDTQKFWLSGNRFSKAVAGFYTVPDPQRNLNAYIDAMRAIAQQENVDFYIPVAMFGVIYYDTHDQPVLGGNCEFFHFDAATTRRLDDKFAFAELARSLKLSVPKSYKITNPEQVLNIDFSQEQCQYLLKSIVYDPVRRLDMTLLPCATPEATAAFVNSLPISADNPWIMQEFISGQEYCTHSTVRDGQLTMYCCCESSAFQVNYQQVDKPQIKQWVKHFAQELKLTGQVSFDFIEAADGTVYAIECNPRTHSAITMFYNHPGVAAAYLDKQSVSNLLEPLPDSKPTYWLYHELWRLTEVRSLKQLQSRIKIILQGKDAIFSVADPLPCLMVYHWQIPLLLLDSLRQLKGWIRIDFNIGELIEF